MDYELEEFENCSAVAMTEHMLSPTFGTSRVLEAFISASSLAVRLKPSRDPMTVPLISGGRNC
jgi:hypothetical protein